MIDFEPMFKQPLYDYYANAAGCGGGTFQEQLAYLRQAPISVLSAAQDAAMKGTMSVRASSYH